ncbi:hypothetical protein FRACYDRAFT_247269 [Fragilariopsis cylindrus CCMP1102]|uniref:Uncharacterized protein n=1 Tax=Fragilariopsis cylindrus CCMP1102 TaxID=635003 RepID=A0A1E7EXQ8_9STRA|nr:hypothetical protein FRACYDRAFT_247269 [Fragilariopsis cylindrus CCMP1102]|eukprot:OEU10313.1 hypothetical protein FRACYDRAFT_247269 [Fragilariopsis cylindrus CCMP1102]
MTLFTSSRTGRAPGSRSLVFVALLIVVVVILSTFSSFVVSSSTAAAAGDEVLSSEDVISAAAAAAAAANVDAKVNADVVNVDVKPTIKGYYKDNVAVTKEELDEGSPRTCSAADADALDCDKNDSSNKKGIGPEGVDRRSPN